jgi:hypothetical protein
VSVALVQDLTQVPVEQSAAPPPVGAVHAEHDAPHAVKLVSATQAPPTKQVVAGHVPAPQALLSHVAVPPVGAEHELQAAPQWVGSEFR